MGLPWELAETHVTNINYYYYCLFSSFIDVLDRSMPPVASEHFGCCVTEELGKHKDYIPKQAVT